MTALPNTILTVLTPFAVLFSTKKTWNHALLLVIGAIICKGGRTVCGALRVMGLKGECTFDKYHKILNRAHWSTLKGSRMLLDKIVGLGQDPIVIAVDEHIERRQGRRIKVKGCYRDAVRSSKKCVVKCFGIKWITVMILKSFSWSPRIFALPFMTILAPSEKADYKQGKKHKTTIDWTIQMVLQIKRWLHNRRIIITGDGGFANIKLAWTCIKEGVELVTRLRLDARLFDFPLEQKSIGRRPKKGRKLLKPAEMLQSLDIEWKEEEVKWYGGKKRKVRYATTTCLWHVEGSEPLPIRLVLLEDSSGEYDKIALMGVDRNFRLTAIEIIEFFVARWNQEVTHREVREHLGVETQRQWSDKAIARTTPVLFALYSLILLMGDHLNKLLPIKARDAAWYQKQHVTFSDVLTEVRRQIWFSRYFNGFDSKPEPGQILSSEMLISLIDNLAEAV